MQSQAIKKSRNTSKTAATEHTCEFCGRQFARAKTVYTHVCEQKRRHQDRDRPANRIGYNSWQRFYNTSVSRTAKPRTYQDFAHSAYYIAFVRYGNYCIDAGVLNSERYLDWLIKNKIKIDEWNSDGVYTRFLCDYLREEDPWDALTRSVKTTDELATLESISCRDVLRWGNKNRICHAITTGRISPWMLYHSDSGRQFLDALDETQVRMVFEYINPELWAIVFVRKPEQVEEIKQVLKQSGY